MSEKDSHGLHRQPPPNTDHACGLWAPELHDINGRWWLLYCAEVPGQGNDSHRLFLLGGPPSNQSPLSDFLSPGCQWQDLGHINGMRPDQWAIDGTYFHIDNQLYMVYAGSPLGQDIRNFNSSELYIYRMRDPTTVASDPPMRLSRPEHSWEHEGAQGINEGPEWLESPDGHWKGIVFSVGATFNCNYKMLTLTYLGGDPLNPANWRKAKTPFCQSSKSVHGPYAPGHGNFVNINGETIACFHATEQPEHGMQGRKARIQRVHWTSDGPTMGGHVGPRVSTVEAFAAGPTATGEQKKNGKDVMRDLKAGYKKYTSGW